MVTNPCSVYDVSGMVVWHACIFRGFKDVKSLGELWQTKCHALAIAQHNADGKTRRVHCHFAIVAPNDKMDTMRKQIRDAGFKGRGNYWITDIVMEGKHAGEPLRFTPLLKYITKGSSFNVKFQHNISNEMVDYAASLWINKSTDKVESSGELSGKVAPAPKKPPKVPYQQQVIALASADWYNYKRDLSGIDIKMACGRPNIEARVKLIEFVCKAMRDVSRGINPYLIEDLARAILYDDLDYREYVVKNIFSRDKL